MYRKKEDGDKTYELYANFGRNRSVGTTQTVKNADAERTISVHLKEEFGKTTCERWQGVITPNLRKYERQFFSDMDLEKGVQAINEFFSQMKQVYNGSDAVMEISDRIVEVSKMLRDEKKEKNATPH